MSLPGSRMVWIQVGGGGGSSSGRLLLVWLSWCTCLVTKNCCLDPAGLLYQAEATLLKMNSTNRQQVCTNPKSFFFSGHMRREVTTTTRCSWKELCLRDQLPCQQRGKTGWALSITNHYCSPPSHSSQRTRWTNNKNALFVAQRWSRSRTLKCWGQHLRGDKDKMIYCESRWEWSIMNKEATMKIN